MDKNKEKKKTLTISSSFKKKVEIKNRAWPNNQVNKCPIWCSVDLRDGNQALAEPMDSARKMKFFKKLIDVGYKEIEVGFPSASEINLA